MNNNDLEDLFAFGVCNEVEPTELDDEDLVDNYIDVLEEVKTKKRRQVDETED